ncbi:uncharacterized protein EV420DRAFT_1269523 [Desarmillaria tabescens]|uniref:NAD(P)-binding protein n=1 Tax=Armillaria tabescens TaxID=1929756 RepID=A0AA39KE66_ARMTA|nr:uncharacterized protein EV420DRAFT_1269523 [Desarmillaria tabescens]KAK0459342.1 hypothetical protein EV420DRAFT_1269523 [Desarmillaria tabescens]
MSDLEGKVVIVTGGSSGIGKEMVRELLLHNAKVYLTARNPEKTRNVIEELTKATGKTAIFLNLNLRPEVCQSRCGGVPLVRIASYAAAEHFSSLPGKRRVYDRCAGGRLIIIGTSQRHAMPGPSDMLTVQGYDYYFGVNVLGHFYFTKLPLPALLATEDKARVVKTSSSAIYLPLGSKILFDTLKDGQTKKSKSPMHLYGQFSMFVDVMFVLELARGYGDKGIVSISLHPGNLKTDLDQHANWSNTVIW